MSKDNSGGFVHECFYRCDSREHASNLTSAVTKANLSDEKVAAYLKWCCVKYAQALDSNGRSLIHVAAAMGRLKLLMFLLTHREVNINCRDQESCYTALHRSLFYGQLHCAVRLIQAGANMQQNDLDDLTPLDHVMKDRPSILTYNTNHPCEVYVWGTNTNYTLGIGHHHSRSNPEPLDFFRKENISIKQAFMSKFHSLFLGSDGKVWACGLGSGGRLGLGDEATALVPKALKIGSNMSETCRAACVGIDHSILLMDNGSVWSFGLNGYHQLGHSPPPEKVLFPKAIKSLRGVKILGINASKFHSVFWNENQLFTCGLHGGHLGHLKNNENTVSVPKLVTSFQLKSSTIKHVVTSDGATVVGSCAGDIYLFYDYQCKKLTSKSLKMPAKKICVLGGHLDHKVFSSRLQEKGGDELKIVVLSETNCFYFWQETSFQFNRCLLSLHRYIEITDVVLNKTTLILTTADGEAFQGEIKIKKKKKVFENEKSSSPKSSLSKFIGNDECDYIKIKRIPHIHRGVNVACDLKGRNFAVVQVHPKMALLEVPLIESTEMKQNMETFLTTTSEFDTLHDVIFEVCGVKFPAHRYIVSHSCEILEEMINKGEVIDDVHIVKIENVQPQIFERILHYLYTGECDLLQTGICPISYEPPPLIKPKEKISKPLEIINNEEISAFEYHKQQRLSKKKNESKAVESKEKDPIRALRDAARIFELTNLSKKLELLRFDAGLICKSNEKKEFELSPPKFNRKNLQNLWDISIKAENDSIIKAHKCILVARSEYFNFMINRGWLESFLKTPLHLPIPSTVLEIFIRYLYTDEAPEIMNIDDPDLASHILVIADQFFCTRLKEIAEASLANMINLKNSAEILQLGVTYNASQLKKCAMEFICLNLSALLESRSLEILDDSLLADLRDFYRSWLSCMNRRNIAANLDEPDNDFVELIYNSEPVSLEKVEEDQVVLKSSSKPSKKKREKRYSESERVRNTSIGSTTSDEELLNLLDNDNDIKEETWIKVTNHSHKLQKSIPSESCILPSEISSSKGYDSNTITSPLAPMQKSSPINVNQTSETMQRNSLSGSFKDVMILNTSFDKEFPALSTSAPERTTTFVTPKSSSESSKKFVKLSQKQRKRLVSTSISEDEGVSLKVQPTVKPAWRISKVEPSSLADIMKEESKNNCQLSSPWQGSSSPPCSLSAIMAAERQQRDLLSKMKSKPLEYTIMEDKAIEALTKFYNVPNVTSERITVKRADSVLYSPPVWISGHR